MIRFQEVGTPEMWQLRMNCTEVDIYMRHRNICEVLPSQISILIDPYLPSRASPHFLVRDVYVYYYYARIYRRVSHRGLSCHMVCHFLIISFTPLTDVSISLYGISLAQAYVYWFQRRRDPLLIQRGVLLVMVMETIHSVLLLHATYHHTILLSGDLSREVTIIWSVSPCSPLSDDLMAGSGVQQYVVYDDHSYDVSADFFYQVCVVLGV